MKTLLTFLSVGLLAFAPAASHGATPSGWTDNYTAALAEAKAEHKKVLLDFSGSDWCEVCVRLNKEVFSTAKFKEYAKKNLVLLEADFPQLSSLSKKVETQNEQLRLRFHVEEFPTVYILNGDGKPLQRLGYMKGGPDAFIAELEAGGRR